MHRIRPTVFQVEKGSRVAVYQQLVDQVVKGFHDHRFVLGDRMPTTREMAGALKINRNTVVKAYDVLKSQGFLEARVGRGTVIAQPRTQAPSAGHLLEEFKGKRDQAKSDAENSTSNKPIMFSLMQPSDDLLPVAAFSRCLEEVLSRYPHEALSYAPPSGITPLRRWIKDELSRMNVSVSVDDIIVTHGASQGLDLLCRAYLRRGDTVYTEDPSYHAGLKRLKAEGVRVLPFPEDEGGPLPPKPRNPNTAIRLGYLIPNFRNPTGTSISLKRRNRLVRWAEAHGVLLVEDDYGFEFALDDTPPPPLKHLSSSHVVYMSSFSKRILPALRIGYLVTPNDELREQLHEWKRMTDLGNSALLQYALLEFLESGLYAQHMQWVLKEYRRRRQAMDRALTAHMPNGVYWQRPKGGLAFWLQLPTGLSVDALVQRCEANNLQIAGGRLWSVDGHTVDRVRLTFCAETESRIWKGVEILGDVLREVMGKGQRHVCGFQPAVV